MERAWSIIVAAVAAAGWLGLCGSPCARAGTIRDDRDDSLYTALAADPQYAGVGEVLFSVTENGTTQNFLASGTLISSQWVLTAGHVVYSPDATVTVTSFSLSNGFTSSAAELVPYPYYIGNSSSGLDIGLIKLSTPVNISPGTGVLPASRFTPDSTTENTELGATLTTVGYGTTGTGLTGAIDPAGTKRAGQNLVSAIGPTIGGLQYGPRLMFTDFDSPTDPSKSFWAPSTPLNLEYLPAAGDSGGGAFIDVNGEELLAGVTSIGLSADPSVPSQYGDLAGYTRVSQYNQWIDDTTSVGWSNAAGGAYSAAGNWAGGIVPGVNDIAGFNTAGTYSITMNGSITNEQLLVRTGAINFNLGGNTWTLTTPAYAGSVVVGKYDTDVAVMTIANGTLASRGAVIAQTVGSFGTVTISGGSAWNSSGQIFVGGSSTAAGGTGLLQVNSQGSLSAVGLNVWSSGTLNVAGTASASTVSNDGIFIIAGTGTATLGSIGGSGATLTGTTTVSGNLSATSIVQASLTVDGIVVLAATPLVSGSVRNPSATTSVVGALSIPGGAVPTGTLNLNNNNLVISNGGAGARNAAQADIAYARNGGLWNRPGIASGTAQSAFAATHFDSETLGVVLNSELPVPYADFGGQAVSSNDVLIGFTYGGDANLDGTINGNDYFQIDRGFLDHYTGWINGDFNYDGMVNGNDYFIIDSNFIDQSGQLAAPEVLAHEAEFGPSYLSDFSSAQLAAVGIPEPASLALLGLGVAGLLGRRRRRR